MTDIAGVSLAAIKELAARDASKDAEIADLKSRLAGQAKTAADIQRQNAQIQAALVELQTERRLVRQ